jgi:hypothetical protein
MSHAHFFAEKAEQLLQLARRARHPAADNSLELSLISIANEFMAKAEAEAVLLLKKRKDGK